MKIKLFFLVIYFYLIKDTFELNENEKPIIKIGAIFFAEETDIELSFDETFREINNLRLFEVYFKTIKRFIPFDDSLILQQITCELISAGVAAIFGPSSKTTSDIVALIANSTGIPHIEFDLKVEKNILDKYNYGMSVNVAPDSEIISRAYFEIIKTNYKWKTFTLIYETDEGLARLQNILNIEAINKNFIKIHKLEYYENDYRVLFKDILETYHEYTIIMDCNPDSLDQLLKISLEFKLMGPFRSWFLTNLDTHSSKLAEIYNEAFKANITSVRLKTVDENPFARKKSHLTQIDQILAKQNMLPLLMHDAVVLLANALRNVIITKPKFREHFLNCHTPTRWYLGPQIVEEMKTITEDSVEPNFKTENLQLDEFGRRTKFNLEIYKPTVNEQLAIWTPDNGIKPPTINPIFSMNTGDTEDFSVAKKSFTVVTHFEAPFFMFKEDHENFRGIEKYEGYAVDVIQKLSELLNFDYKFMIVNGNGKYDPETKEWDGIMRKLIDHQAEIGICDMTITHLRRKAVDFTVPFMQLGISILYYKSPPEPKEMFAFLKPFAPEVWYYMILTQLVMTLSFVFLARLSKSEWERPNPADQTSNELENIWNTSNSFWLMIGSIMQQGCDILPKGPAMRILSGLWWFFALIMLSTYTANLAAFLTMEKSQITINSLSDLVEQDKVKFGTLAGGSTSQFFSDSNDTEYSKAWNQMKSFEPSAFTTSTKEGVERVLKEKGNYAFLMETTSLMYNVERNCFLKEIGSQIGEKHYGIAVPLGAAYRSNLSVSILQLSEKGELYKLKNKWWKNPNGTCVKAHEVDGDELSIIELGGVFLVLVGGVLLAMVIGIFEFLWNVERVAVEQSVTPGEAFKAELLFVLKFWIKRKPALIKKDSTTTSTSSNSISRHVSTYSCKTNS